MNIRATLQAADHGRSIEITIFSDGEQLTINHPGGEYSVLLRSMKDIVQAAELARTIGTPIEIGDFDNAWTTA